MYKLEKMQQEILFMFFQVNVYVDFDLVLVPLGSVRATSKTVMSSTVARNTKDSERVFLTYTV